MPDATVLLEARELARRPTPSGPWLLRDVELELRAGQCLGVVGPSGSGKTLLLRSLALLDPLDTGYVLFRGRPVSGNGIPDFRSRVIYLRQRPALEAGTVEDNLRRPLQLYVHRKRRLDLRRIGSWLRHLGRRENFLEKRRGDLSGGEQQIVALIATLQLDPTVLLLDEPVAALDHDTARSVELLLRQWVDEQPSARAQMWVSHDVERVRSYCSKLLRMEDGRLYPM